MNIYLWLRRIAQFFRLNKRLVKCECVGENAYWQDCPKHGDVCNVSCCLRCGEYEYADCEFWNDRRY